MDQSVNLTPSMVDFANHSAGAIQADIKKLCEAVIQYGFNSAFVNPCHVAYAKSLVGGKAKVGTVISFPLGQDILEVKIHAIREAIADGADELDIVPNHAALLDKHDQAYADELYALVHATRSMRRDIIIKFIIETGLFSDNERVAAAALAITQSGADFIKLCSGMGPRGVSVDDVSVVRQTVGPTMKIKGAGGIKTREQALALVAAGANRLGTSHAKEIITDVQSSNVK